MLCDVEQTARSADRSSSFRVSKSEFQRSARVLMSATVNAAEPGWTSLFADCCFSWKSGQLQSYQFDSEFSPAAVKWKMRQTCTATVS